MDVSDALKAADSILLDPLRSQVKSLFTPLLEPSFLVALGGKTVMMGELLSAQDNWLDLSAALFTPGGGFGRADENDTVFRIFIQGLNQRSLCLHSGMNLVCCGYLKKMDNPRHFTLDDASVSYKPDLMQDMPWNVFHSFAGSYAGWSQSMHWLKSNTDWLILGQEYFLDADPMVMQLWSTKYQQAHVRCPVSFTTPWPHGPHVGMCGCVSDLSVLNLLRTQTNLVHTLSPPCQSWSKGGRAKGLADSNGQAFIESIQLSFAMQPNFMALECADELTKHEHYQFVLAYAKALGYRQIWSQITPYHTVANHHRTRWLAVWTRSDHGAHSFPFQLNLSIVPRCPWTDSQYRFRLPPTWASQLVLSPSECEIYNNNELLPPAKRLKMSGPLYGNEVLHQRVLKPGEVLPTLCASYGTQHLLASTHIRSKGIYAHLRKTERGFEFFDPAMFCCLFGAIEETIMPIKIGESFHGIGNAVSIPHSLLTLCIGFQALTEEAIDPIQLVKRAWKDKLTVSNAILFEQGDFVHLQPIVGAMAHVKPRPSMPCEETAFVCVTGSYSGADFGQQVPAHIKVRELFHLCFQGPGDLVSQISLGDDSHQAEHSIAIRSLASSDRLWHLFLGPRIVGQCAFSTVHSPVEMPAEVICISPTQPISYAEHTIELPSVIPFDIVATPEFRRAQQVIETLQDDMAHKSVHVAILQVGSRFALWITCSPRQQLDLIEKLVHAVGDDEYVHEHQCTIRGIPSLFVLIGPRERACTEIDIIVSQGHMGYFQAIRLPDQCLRCLTFKYRNEPMSISHRNDKPVEERTALQHGDIVRLKPMPVTAGGHHQSGGRPPFLEAGANFASRAEFATNTHGWLATDEMWAATQTLMWTYTDLKFTPPMLWNPSSTEFDESAFGEPSIANNSITIIPLLVSSHWGAIEITHRDDTVNIVMVQIPRELQNRAIFIVARLLDIGPHRIGVATQHEITAPHVCGWNLLFRWYTRCNAIESIADLSNHYDLPGNYADIVNFVIQASVEEWRATTMSQYMCHFAVRIRRNFFLQLAHQEARGRESTQTALYVVHPPGTRLPSDQVQETLSIVDYNPIARKNARVQARLQHFSQYPGWMATDEFDYTLDTARAMSPSTLFCPPAIWSSIRRDLHFLNDLIPDYGAHVIWFIIIDNHWLQVEVYITEQDASFGVTSPPSMRQSVEALIEYLIDVTKVDRNNLQITFIDQSAPPHMCGYQLLYHIHQRLGIGSDAVTASQRRQLACAPFAATVYQIQQADRNVWLGAEARDNLVTFATNVRNWFLVQVTENRFPAHYFAAGVEGDVTMQPADPLASKSSVATSKKSAAHPVDILQIQDPWIKKAPRPAQSRWEDLQIKGTIPFNGSDGKPMTQCHRLQVGPSRGGLILATKIHLADLSKTQGSADLAVLIPIADNIHLPHVAQKLEGPYELSMDDPMAKVAYKRLVMLFVIRGKVSFYLPEPKVKLVTSAVSEIVLEVDARLLPKNEFDRLRDNPIQSFKSLLAEIDSGISQDAVLYGYRTCQAPGGAKTDLMMQCILKLPTAARSKVIEASASGYLLTRDFLERGKQSDDTTVLPRFWSSNPNDLHDMRKAIAGVDGIAGIVTTKRGLAPRVWVASIVQARKLLMASDSRLTSDNYHVIPKFTYEMSGWPAATGAQHVVASTLQAIHLAVVPMRTYRSAGVHTWIVATQEKPTAASFSIQINKEIAEILIQEIEVPSVQKQKGKGTSKGKPKQARDGDTATPWPPRAPASTVIQNDDHRIVRLEERFERLEARQNSFEHRVDDKFDTIQDSLRQLLAHTVPRARDSSGDTPQPKAQKTS